MDVRVLLDGHMIGQGETGNETYITNLAYGLSRLPDVVCTAAVNNIPPADRKISGVSYYHLPSQNNWHRLLFGLWKAYRDTHSDLLHVTYNAPFIFRRPVIISIHDVSFKRYPHYFSPKDRFLFSTLFRLSINRADAIITISEHARKEITQFFPRVKDRIFVTSLAHSNIFIPNLSKSKHRITVEKYCVKEPFILAVGNLQPRKNLIRLIKAFSKSLKAVNNLQLVIVGKEHWRSSEVFQLVRQLGLKDKVVFTGYVPNEDLVSLYNLATAFVYPSLYEGFGLPVLEAMACATPVITSNISSMPEVAGDAAILIDPYQETEMSQAIINVLTDRNLASDLAERGYQRSQHFSWEQTARQTMNVYQTVLRNKENH